MKRVVMISLVLATLIISLVVTATGAGACAKTTTGEDICPTVYVPPQPGP